MSHCDDGHCITCSDEGVPMRIERLEVDGLAVCRDEGGVQTSVMTDLVERPAPGDLLLVHAGVALTRLEEGVAA